MARVRRNAVKLGSTRSLVRLPREVIWEWSHLAEFWSKPLHSWPQPSVIEYSAHFKGHGSCLARSQLFPRALILTLTALHTHTMVATKRSSLRGSWAKTPSSFTQLSSAEVYAPA